MAELWNCTAEEYHADESRESCGRIGVFGDSVPRYHRRFIEKAEEVKGATYDQMLGSCFHLRVLEPDKYVEQVARAPDVLADNNSTVVGKAQWEAWQLLTLKPELFEPNFAVVADELREKKKTKAGKAAWEAAEELHAGKTIITETELAEVREHLPVNAETAKYLLTQEEEHLLAAMQVGISENPEAVGWLTKPGRNEQGVIWEDQNTGIACRMLADRLLEEGTVIGLKSSKTYNPEAFARDAVNFGWHVEAAWYRRGASALFGQQVRFIFVVVAKTPTYEAICYELDDEAMELGDAIIAGRLSHLRDCRDTDRWVSDWWGKTVKLSLPGYAFRKGLAG